MNTKKLELFIEYLVDDISWRKKELTELFFIHDKHENIVTSKSLILMIYSHWEGYVKNACKQYLLYVSEMKIDLVLLTANFKAISLKGFIKETVKSNNTLTLNNEINLIRRLSSESNAKFNVKKQIMEEKNKDIINTTDNLSLNVLNNFCDIVGIGKITPVEGREKYLDEALLMPRNAISHGTKTNSKSIEFNITSKEINTIRGFIFILMDYIKEELDYFASKELYLISHANLKTERSKTSDQDLIKKITEL